ncbi:MAG: DUF4230 domain-containing protein [Paludibacteraceae bacterium]|nr:DUF4230 domain-containing protein [Paludibacteraceae bacterium]
MNISKFRILIILSILLLIGGCSSKEKTQEEKNKSAILSVSKCSKLYTVQYNIRKIITYEDMSAFESSLFFQKISIPIPGDRKIAIPVDATIKAYIDFSGFNESNVKFEGEKVTVTLPDPKMELTSSKIDHYNEKEFRSWNRTRFSEEEKRSFLQQGITSIMAKMKDTDIIDRSRTSAYTALLPIFTAVGYSPENITINFREEIENNKHEEKTIFDMYKESNITK